jgi:hypothetical protein
MTPQATQGIVGVGLMIAGYLFVVFERVRRRRRW